MNYRSAIIVAGAGAIGLLIVGGALAAVIVFGYLIAAEHLFGGGFLYAELFALIALPSAVGASGVLLTKALGSRGLRTFISVATGFILAINVVLKELGNTSSSSDEESSLATMFLLVSALTVLIATVRRVDIGRSRMWAIITLVIVFVATGFAGIVVVPPASVEESVLVAGGLAWIVLPTLAALFVPPTSGEPQVSGGSSLRTTRR